HFTNPVRVLVEGRLAARQDRGVNDVVHGGLDKGTWETIRWISLQGNMLRNKSVIKVTKSRTRHAAMLTMDQGRITCRQTPLPMALRLFSGFLGVGIGTVIPAVWIGNVTSDTPVPILLLVALVTAVSV